MLPIVPGSKQPLGKLAPNGLKNASCDPVIITGWWTKEPQANVAIATGAASGLVVLDVDAKSGGDETLADLETLHGKLPQTVEVLTGGGGRHLYFRWPGRQISNSAGKIGPGLDIRGDGGYVVAPPSLHQSGQRYRWEISSDPSDVELAEIPTWLLQLIADVPSKNGHVQTGSVVNPSYLPLSKAALEFVANGAPIGQQRDRAIKAARSYLGAGYSVQDAAAAIWRGLQASPVGDPSKPWTYQDAIDIAQDLASRPAPPPTPLQKPQPSRQPSTAASLTPIDSPLRRTDAANAEFFAHLYGDKMRYDHLRSRWLRWDTHWWVEDSDAEVRRLAEAAARELYRRAAAISDPDTMKKVSAWALSSLQRKGLDATVYLAQAQHPLADKGANWDSNPWLLGVGNGVVDLATGQLQPGQQLDRITKHTDVVFDPDATCPMWEAFLNQIMAGNQNLIAFLQRAIGYSLTGITSERVIFILHGSGANGKSTLLETVRSLLGEYALRTPTETLMVKQQSGIPNDIARLKGSRFVFASETEDGKRLAEALVKDLTGDDVISARFMRSEFFDFKPEFKIWMGTNHKPVIRGTDKAIWDRLKLIPFNVRIPEDQRDKHLADKLREELPGILQWTIRGCLEWQRMGLGVPDEVKQATEDYRAEMDTLAEFLGECCVLHPAARVGTTALYSEYTKWCEGNKEKSLSKQMLFKRLKERGLDNKRSGGSGNIEWHGIGLRAADSTGFTEVLKQTEAVSGLNPYEKDILETIGKTTSGDFSTSVEQGAFDLPSDDNKSGGIQVATARKTVDRGKMQELMDQGYSKAEAIGLATIQQEDDPYHESESDYTESELVYEEMNDEP